MPTAITRLPRIPWDGDKPITALQEPFGEVTNLTIAFIGAGAPHAAGVDTNVHIQAHSMHAIGYRTAADADSVIVLQVFPLFEVNGTYY